MQKTIDILEVAPPKTGISKAGKTYSITECECVSRPRSLDADVEAVLLEVLAPCCFSEVTASTRHQFSMRIFGSFTPLARYVNSRHI